MSESTQIEYMLTVNVERANSDLRRLESVVAKALNQVAKLTNNKSIDEFNGDVLNLISLIRQAQTEARILAALTALSAPELFTVSGGIKIASAIVGGISIGMSASDYMMNPGG